MSNSTGSDDPIGPSVLLQFNATIVVGIFLFLTLGASGSSALIILTTIFPFVVSATLILVYGIRDTGSDGRVRYVSSTLSTSKWLAAGGTIYLIAILIVLFVLTTTA